MEAQEGGLYARVPPSPPIVEMGGGEIGHLLCWELHERDASWRIPKRTRASRAARLAATAGYGRGPRWIGEHPRMAAQT